MQTYCGLTFPEAHAIFKQDSWFAKPSPRYLQIKHNGNDICAEKVNKPTDGYELVSKTAEFETEQARAALTEKDLNIRDNLLSFMFSVRLNKAPLAFIKDKLPEINQNLDKVEDKDTYKKYVGHLAWLKTNHDPSSDPLTQALFSKLGKGINKDDIDVNLSVNSEYFRVFKDFLESGEKTEPILNGLSMDLNRFNNFYSAVSSSHQKGGRKTRRARSLKKKTNGKRKNTMKYRSH
jgi:hypothetical protein